jgi:hypothetical protein
MKDLLTNYARWQSYASNVQHDKLLITKESRAKPAFFCYLQVLAHSPEDIHSLLQLSMQLDLSHDFEHLVQLFILLLQHGVLAKDIAHIENNITIVMKRNFFMIQFLICLIINSLN